MLDRLMAGFFVWPASPEGADEDAFHALCDRRFDRNARLVAVVFALFAVVFWPSDLVTLRRLPEAVPVFVAWRLSAAGGAALYVLVPRRLVFGHVKILFALSTGVAYFITARAFARIGGLELPYVHFCYVMPFVTIALPLRFVERAIITTFVAATAFLGVFLPFPAIRESPFVPMALTQMSGMIGLSLLFGHLLLMLLRQNFLQAQELARRAAALKRYGEHLEERVAEKTRELRELLAYVETARESERKRIAGELHDALGQELLAIRYALSYARTKYGTEPLCIAPNLSELNELLARTANTMREIMAQLRPRILDDMGFVAAARWLVDSVAERSGFACELRLSGEPEHIDPGSGTAAFRILQEALTNVAKHARAQRVEVKVDVGREHLDLAITDDGIGIAEAAGGPSGAEPPKPRLGLLGMRERAGALGGTLSISKRPEGGTMVRCVLPRHRAEAA